MKELKYYLWKLKYLEGVKVSKKEFDKKNLPNDIYYSEWSGKYTKISSQLPFFIYTIYLSMIEYKLNYGIYL